MKADLWNDSLLSSLILSHHRVALSGSGLSIREDADVVAFKGMFKHLNAEVFVNALLCSVLGVPRLEDGTLNIKIYRQ